MERHRFKYISQNIASSRKIERVTELLKRCSPDLLLLQEVTLTTAQLKTAVEGLQYSCESNIDIDNPTFPGTAIVWKNDLPEPQVTSLVTCNLQSVQIGRQFFYNVYAPSGSQNRRIRALFFTQDVFTHLLQHQARLLPVLAGDWNCLVAAKDTTAHFNEKYSKDLDNLVKHFNYSDAYRIQNPNKNEFTFHRASCAPSRLDRVYLPPHLVHRLITVTHQPGLADHWGVHTELDIEISRIQLPPRPKTSHWKLNTSILSDESFLPQFTSLFTNLQEEQAAFEDAADWWDMFAKPALITFCKSISVALAKKRRVFKNFLFALLRVATRSENWTLVTQTKEKLQTIFNFEAHGLIIRSREKQNAEEESASLYHLSKIPKSGLTSLKVSEDGVVGYKAGANMQVTRDQDRIEQKTVHFMNALLNGRQDQKLQDTGVTFQPDYSDLEYFLSSLSQLSQDSQNSLVVPLTFEEVEGVLKSCQNGKAPGLDGLPYEFYKKTWPVIGETLTKVLQTQLDRVKLIESSRHGATRLISKVDGVPDVTELKPITLLQVDYRMLSKCLAVRLHAVMHEVVDPKQLGTPVPGQGGGILTGVYEILSSIDYINKNNLQGYLASFDNVKAYDRSSTAYLDKVMERMAFPLTFRMWLQMLHKGATTRIILPTGLSRKIEVTFSYRQGDCIAGDLFCLNQEPLLRKLRERVVGLLVSDFFRKDTSYLDDIQLISADEQDLITFNKVMNMFEAQSGAMLSRGKKSKVMGLGGWEGRNEWPQEVNWLQTVVEMKILGFTVCPQFPGTLQRTWEVILRGLQKTLFSWGGRALNTLQQRVNVLQTFALSKLWYAAQVLPLPDKILKKIESASSTFIFQGRHERLKLDELQNPKSRGGLGLVCVSTKAECLLLRQSLRILSRQDQNCRKHLNFWLGSELQEYFPELDNQNRVSLNRFPLHKTILEILQEGIMRQEFNPAALNMATSKSIYTSRASDVIPPPKVEGKNPGVDFLGLVYPRLNSNILEAEPKDTLFCMVHNLHPTKERLHQQHRAQDPYCPLPQCQGLIQDREHIFSSCYLVSQAWLWLRRKLLQLLPTTVGAVSTSSEDFLLLKFPKDTMDKEIVWLVGNYCDIVIKEAVAKKRRLSAVNIANLMKNRLEPLKYRAVMQPQIFDI